MINICIKDIVEATKGKLLCGDEKQQIDHLSIDSRSSQGNDLFIPIIGAKVDAHRFIDGAFSVGCVATLTSEHDSMDDPNHAWIRVEDTVLALHEIGKLCRSRVTVPAIGVTGSVGKTTTREMIAYALSAEKKVYKTQKNYNSSVGLPITMSLMSNDYDIAVLELGMNVPGELGTISEIAQLKMAVLTNVGVAHIEFYGSQEAICHEKYTISKGFGKEGLLIVNGDDELLYKFRESTGYPYVLYGTKEYCDYRAEDIHMENGHYAFTFVHNEMRVPVVLSVLGQHNVLNATAALAAAPIHTAPAAYPGQGVFTQYDADSGQDSFAPYAIGPGLNNLSTQDDYAAYQWAFKNDGQVQKIERKLDIKTVEPIIRTDENGVDTISLPPLGPSNFKASTSDAVKGIDINLQPAWELYNQIENK